MISNKCLSRRFDFQADKLFYCIWLLVVSWLFLCAWVIQGETGDGYQTIANSRYLYSGSPDYYGHRGPLAGIVLWPAEIIVSLLNLKPLDVRPYHFLSALLHSLYLLGCWLLAKRQGSAGYAHVAAFVVAILTMVFFANAPFLSHDLIPGLLFLLLIFYYDRWLKNPGIKDSLALILLGFLVTIIKQTFAVFWIALLIYTFLSFLFSWDEKRVTCKKMALLLLFAAISGILSWLSYGLFYANVEPDLHLLLRPAALIKNTGVLFKEDLENFFPANLYLINLHNYNLAAILLIVPGVIMALKGSDSRLRITAICWIISALVVQSIGFREVRYMAILAPLTFFLIIEPIKYLFEKKLSLLLLLLVVFDLARTIPFALAHPGFDSRLNMERFFESHEHASRVFAFQNLTFVYLAASPLKNDIYHGIYQVSSDEIYLLNRGKLDVINYSDPGALATLDLQKGDRIFYANNAISRIPPWSEDNIPRGLSELVMVAGEIDAVKLIRKHNGFVINADSSDKLYLLIPDESVGRRAPVISAGMLSVNDAKALYGDLSQYDVIDIKAVKIEGLCRADRCFY